MRTLSVVVSLLVLGSASAADPTPETVAKLIAQLGSPDYRVRETASKELEALGSPVLPALKSVAASSSDAEAARRAAELTAKISRRLDNDKTLAPTLVELNFEDAALATVLAELQKQAGGRLAFDNLDALGGKVTVKTAGKVPFWEAMAKVCDAARLEVVSGAAPQSASSPRSREAQLLAERQAAMADVMARQQALMRERLKVAQAEAGKKASDAEKKKIEELLQKQKLEMEGVLAQLAQMQARQLALDRSSRSTSYSSPVNTGVIELRPRSEAANPSCVSGAVRIEAMPFPAAVLVTVPRDTIPVILHTCPEPRLKWERIESVRMTKATDDAGRELSAVMADATVHNTRVLPIQGGAVVMDPRGGVNLVPGRGSSFTPGFLPTAAQSLLHLKAAGGTKTLKVLEGAVRGTVRTGPEDLATVTGLDKKAMVSALGASGVAMTVTVAEQPDGESFEIQATLRYNPTEVQLSGRPDYEETVINQARGRVIIRGQARIVGGAQLPPRSGSNTSFGLTATSADGKSYTLTAHSSMRAFDRVGGEVTDVVKLTARPTEKDQGAPAKVSIRGTRSKMVEVPFKLTDVPVSVGNAEVQDVSKKSDNR